MAYRETNAVRPEIHTKHTNALWEQNVELFMVLNLGVWKVTTRV